MPQTFPGFAGHSTCYGQLRLVLLSSLERANLCLNSDRRDFVLLRKMKPTRSSNDHDVMRPRQKRRDADTSVRGGAYIHRTVRIGCAVASRPSGLKAPNSRKFCLYLDHSCRELSPPLCLLLPTAKVAGLINRTIRNVELH